MRGISGGALALVAAWGLLGCGDDDGSCAIGTTLTCRCAGGESGTQVCTADGFEPCHCGVDAGLDAGADDGGAALDAPADDAFVRTDAGADDGGGIDAGPGRRVIGARPVAATPLSEGTLFAAPDGTGTECSLAAPCSLIESTRQAESGSVVLLRGGTYPITENVRFRGQGSGVHFESHPDEWAVLDGSGLADRTEVYIRVLGDAPVTLRRIEVTGMPHAGISIRSSDHLLEGVVAQGNRGTGIHIHESYEVPSSNRNVLRDCVAYDNSDADGPAEGGNADGISISSGIGNRVEHCTVYGNSDDGVDTWRSQDSVVTHSITWGNGLARGNGQGFKAGGAAPSRGTVVEYSVAYQNRAAGFDFNSGAEVVFRHCTAWDNGGSGFYAGDDTLTERSIGVGSPPFAGEGIRTDNSWQRSGDVVFLSTDPEHPNFLVPVLGGGFEDLGAHAP